MNRAEKSALFLKKVEVGIIDLKNTIKNAKKKSKKSGIMILGR